MNKKVIAVLSVLIGVVVCIAIFKTLMVEEKPKVFIDVRENESSGWYRSEGSPVFGANRNTLYDTGDINRSFIVDKPSIINLGVSVYNNYSLPLYYVKVQISYRQTSNVWNTTTLDVTDFLLPQTSKQMYVTLTEPYLTQWETEQYVNSQRINNVTVWVLEKTDYKISQVYGYYKQ